MRIVNDRELQPRPQGRPRGTDTFVSGVILTNISSCFLHEISKVVRRLELALRKIDLEDGDFHTWINCWLGNGEKRSRKAS